MGDITEKIFVGLQTSSDKVYVLKRLSKKDISDEILTVYSQSLEQEVKIERGLLKPFLMGKDVKRYKYIQHEHYVIFPYLLNDDKAALMDSDYLQKNFPLGWKYLQLNKETLEKRERYKFKDTWWQFSRPQSMNDFKNPKIITPEISLGCNMSLDNNGLFYHTTKVYGISVKPSMNSLFFLGLLNSPILWFFLTVTGYTLRGGYYVFKTEYLKPFPIPQIDLSKKEDKNIHDKIVSLVDSMLSLHQRLSSAQTDQDRTILQRQIDAMDEQINRLVYELYELTEEEIRIVEGEK